MDTPHGSGATHAAVLGPESVDAPPAVRMSASVRRILMPELTQAVRSVMQRLTDPR